MTNEEALKSMCNAIASTFYPDAPTMRLVLLNEGIDAGDRAKPKDVTLFRIAVRLVIGYVEASRSEQGISTSVREDAIKNSIAVWCREYGIDADEFLEPVGSSIEDITHIW